MEDQSNHQQIKEKLTRRMEAVGCSWSDLAKETGYSRPHIINAIAQGNPSQKLRRAIEHAIQEPIWSTPEEFKEAESIRDLFAGKHPAHIPVKVLRKIAKHHRIDYWNYHSRTALLAELIPHLRATEEARKRMKEIGPIEFLKERIEEMRGGAECKTPIPLTPPIWPRELRNLKQ